MQLQVDPTLGRSDPGGLLQTAYGFGKVFCDRMLTARWLKDKGWHDWSVGAYRKFELDPAATVLHYGQEVFEGYKVYHWDDGTLSMFRPRENASRMNESCRRLCIPEVPVDDHIHGVEALVSVLRRWVPKPFGHSLYVRPTVIGIEPFLGVRAAADYLFYIICSPAAGYFEKGFEPVRVHVSEEYVRAVRGGMGAAKTAGNYAGTLRVQMDVKKDGFDQVLWLDGVHRRYIEEMGGMNFFLVYDRHLVTCPAPAGGSILPGVTRKSILAMAGDLGYTTEERSVPIDEALADIKAGRITEAFACGTAAVVTPVKLLRYQGEIVEFTPRPDGGVARRVFDELTGIQYGRRPDPYGWVHKLDLPPE